jgi:hypothetical protein
MLKVHVKLKDKKFTVPIPYPVLNIFGSVISSKRLIKFINTAIEKEGKKLVLPQIDRKDLKPLLRALLENKGLLLVETKLKDGTEVTVKL